MPASVVAISGEATLRRVLGPSSSIAKGASLLGTVQRPRSAYVVQLGGLGQRHVAHRPLGLGIKGVSCELDMHFLPPTITIPQDS